MKKIGFYIVALAIGFVGFQSCSDDDDDNGVNVPTELKDALLAKYPNAASAAVEWELKHNYYVAEFKETGVEKDVWFSKTGEWVMTETDVLGKANLPEAVQTAFAGSEYANWTIDDIDLYERAGETFYLIEVEKAGERDYNLYYNPDGTSIKAVPDAPNDDILPTTNLAI